MKKTSELMAGSAMTVFKTTIVVWLLCLSQLNFDFTAVHIAVPYLMTAALIAYYVNFAMIHKSAPLPLFVIAQPIMVAGGVYVFLHSVHMEPDLSRPVVVNCVVYGAMLLSTGFTAYERTRQSGLLLSFDVTVAMALLLMVSDRLKPIPAKSIGLVTCFACIGVTMLALLTERSGRYSADGVQVQGSPVMGRVMVGAAFAAVSGLTAILVSFASGGVRSISQAVADAAKWVAAGVKKILIILWNGLNSFMEWLSSLVKSSEGGAAPALPEMGVAADGGFEQVEMEIPAWFYWLMLAAAVCVLGLIAIKMRSLSFGKRSGFSYAPPAELKRESGMKNAFLALADKLRRWMKYRRNCVRYRRTPAGLLAFCEKKARGPLARSEGESGEAFLRRLAEREGGEEYAGCLLSLADAVERSFYSPAVDGVSRELYREIKKVKFKSVGK